MIRYLEVFFRHKIALSALMLLTLVVSTFVVMLMPRNYQVTASLWFDHSPIPDNSVLAASTTPADEAAAAFHEVLNTRDFDIKVGRRGPLATYYESTGNFPNSDPVTPLIHWLERKPAPTGATRTALVNNGVVLTLQKYVVVTPTEPQEVGLSFTFSDATVAAGTLQAFIDQFGEQVKASALATAQSTMDFYTAQVATQLKVVQAADAAVASYVAAHPELRAQNPPPDPTYAGLLQTDDLARQDYAALTKKVDQAKLDVASLQQPGPYGFRVIDLPQAPLSSTGLLKSVLFGVGGGLGVGLFLVGVICFLLVAADDSVMRGADLQRSLKVRVIGEVPLLPTHPGRASKTLKALPPKVV